MEIRGIEKVTLIDYPGKIACTIFLFGCNFRCGFCHNPELVVNDCNKKISERYVLEFLNKRKGELDGVCITGGEPLMNIDKNFLREIKKIGYSIKIDTNGSFPEKLKELIDEDLIDFIAMDLKSSTDNYEKVANVKFDLNKIEESVKLISSSGKDYEFRTTIVPELHEADEIRQIGEWMNSLIGKKPKKFVLQGFKNNGKFIDMQFANELDVQEDVLENIRDSIKDFFEVVEIRV